jgi:hypothetical protein
MDTLGSGQHRGDHDECAWRVCRRLCPFPVASSDGGPMGGTVGDGRFKDLLIGVMLGFLGGLLVLFLAAEHALPQRYTLGPSCPARPAHVLVCVCVWMVLMAVARHRHPYWAGGEPVLWRAAPDLLDRRVHAPPTSFPCPHAHTHTHTHTHTRPGRQRQTPCIL